MQHTRLKNTSLLVSRACLGTMTFGGQVDAPAARRMVDLCLDRGVNFFDTANVYNQGKSEEILGAILGTRRSKVILASKVRGKMGDGPDDAGLSPAAMRKAIDASLKRLETDYLDICYFHQPDYDVPLVDSLVEMDALIRAGKVRYAATSNYAAWQVAEIVALCREHSLAIPWIAQPMYNLLARGIEREFLPMARHYGISSVVYNPLAGGLLTGKQHRNAPATGTRFDGNDVYLKRYWHAALFDAVDELRVIASSGGFSLVQLSLGWLLNHTSIEAVILGASRLEQLEENLDACDTGPLPEPVVVDCDGVWARLQGPTPAYSR